MRSLGGFDGIASDDLNRVLELPSAERHPKVADRSNRKRPSRFQEAPFGAAIQHTHTNMPGQCCEALADMSRIFNSLSHPVSPSPAFRRAASAAIHEGQSRPSRLDNSLSRALVLKSGCRSQVFRASGHRRPASIPGPQQRARRSVSVSPRLPATCSARRRSSKAKILGGYAVRTRGVTRQGQYQIARASVKPLFLRFLRYSGGRPRDCPKQTRQYICSRLDKRFGTRDISGQRTQTNNSCPESADSLPQEGHCYGWGGICSMRKDEDRRSSAILDGTGVA